MSTLLTPRANTASSSMAIASTPSHKRAVNLTLSEGLVLQAKSYTANLSATVEALLLEYVATQQRAKGARQQQVNNWCADWNAVHSSVGSFADEYSTL